MNTVTRPGRPRLGIAEPEGRSPAVQTRLPQSVYDAFINLVETSDSNSSEMLRQAVTLFLAHNGAVNDSAIPHSRGLREDRVELALTREVVKELLQDPDRVRSIARENLAKRQPDNAGVGRLYVQWRQLIEQPETDIAIELLADSAHAHDLRQVAPFAGVLSDEQRLAAIERASK